MKAVGMVNIDGGKPRLGEQSHWASRARERVGAVGRVARARRPSRARVRIGAACGGGVRTQGPPVGQAPTLQR